MNQSPGWHREQAAIQQRLANTASMRGYHGSAWKHTEKAQQHRDKAAQLEKNAAA